MATTPKLLIANWKMNPDSEKAAVSLGKAEDLKGAVICPPFVYLSAVKKVLKKASLGAQTVSAEEGGAHTGEISIVQLKALGVKYIILGHSERRALGENNDLIAKKVVTVLDSGLMPVLCVGENQNEKAMGRSKEIVLRQVELGLSMINREAARPDVIIAYEPVWAISTSEEGHADTPENAVMMITEIRKKAAELHVRPIVIYGGSVNSSNWPSFSKYPEVQGALVGGASLKAPEFKKIINTN